HERVSFPPPVRGSDGRSPHRPFGGDSAGVLYVGQPVEDAVYTAVAQLEIFQRAAQAVARGRHHGTQDVRLQFLAGPAVHEGGSQRQFHGGCSGETEFPTRWYRLPTNS